MKLHLRSRAQRIMRRIALTSPRAGQTGYLFWAAIQYFPDAAVASLRRRLNLPNKRRPSTVQAAYDKVRSQIKIIDFESYVFGPNREALVLRNGKIQVLNRAEVAREEREHAVAVLAKECEGIKSPTVVEFGSGFGANLLLLKKRHPHIRVIGLELSEVSVELSRRAADQFGLDVEFYQADVTQSPPDIEGDVDVCFSFHALEQMPEIYRFAVDNMLSLARNKVIFFEPIGEVWPKSTRGNIARMRLTAVNYLKGLYDYLQDTGRPITVSRNLGMGLTPLNETVEVHVVVSGASDANS